jgi:hypothetical protein
LPIEVLQLPLRNPAGLPRPQRGVGVMLPD